MGTGSFPGVKQPGRGADHLPPSSGEVTKRLCYTTIHHPPSRSVQACIAAALCCALSYHAPFYYMYNEQTNAHLTDSLLHFSLFIAPKFFNAKASSSRSFYSVPAKLHKREDEVLALKYIGKINKEQYNKLSVKCAFVCSLYI
jgi:hypothetical protein